VSGRVLWEEHGMNASKMDRTGQAQRCGGRSGFYNAHSRAQHFRGDFATAEEVECAGQAEVRPRYLIQPQSLRRAETAIDAQPSVLLLASVIEDIVVRANVNVNPRW
jgi:hypothetical protein